MGELARQCQTSCIRTTLEIFLGLVCVLVGVWVASLVLELTNFVGITTVPPGVKYVDYRLTGR